MNPGQFYETPEGVIYVTSGAVMSNGWVSNFFNWIDVKTMERKSGYGTFPATPVHGWRISGFEHDEDGVL